MLKILDESPKASFLKFLELVRQQNINPELVKKIADDTVSYLKHPTPENAARQALEIHWYESIAQGKPDFSVYDRDEYLGELWACWLVYSRTYLRNIRQLKYSSVDSKSGNLIIDPIGNVNRVIDLGCGFGYTTAGLKQLFPAAEVFGTNLEGVQARIAREVASECKAYILTNIPDEPVDLVFASEYFEHVVEPIEHLEDVLDRLRPRALFIANSFGTRGLGHLLSYQFRDDDESPKFISAMFALTMKNYGYHRLKTGMWNDRPTLWVSR